MARFKYCNELISSLDKEVCPFCGGRYPLEGNSNETEDFTKSFEAIPVEDNFKLRSKVTSFILFILLGFLGVGHFYLGFKKRGLIALAISLVLIGGVGSLIFFLAWKNILIYVFIYLAILVVNIIIGLNYLLRHDLKDNNGEFLK